MAIQNILLRNIGGVDDKRIVLSNGQFGRTMAIGTAWTRLRIGLRWCMADSGADIVGTPRLAVGVCAGLTNLFGDVTTTNFTGAVTNVVTLARKVGTPPWYGGGVGAMLSAAKRVGSTTTFVGGLAASYEWLTTTPANGNRTLLLVEITKGSPNYSYRTLSHNTGSVDVSQSTLFSVMEMDPPVLTGHLYGGEVTLAVDQTPGVFDGINVMWNRTTPALEISDLAYAVLA